MEFIYSLIPIIDPYWCNRDLWDVYLVQEICEEEAKSRAHARNAPQQLLLIRVEVEEDGLVA